MASPCNNNPNEVISKIVSAKANADKFDKFVNGTDTETVQLGAGAQTPVVRNVVRQLKADANWLKQFVADAPEGDVSLNNATAMHTTESRLLADRFGDVLNVLDFGAVGDGATNDSTAIQAAFNAGALQGKAVFFPAGRKWRVATLNVPSNTTLIANHAVLVHDGSSYFTTNSETGVIDPHPVLKVGSNVTIDSLTIELPEEQNTGLDGAMLGIYVGGTDFHADELFFTSYPTVVTQSQGEGVADNEGCDGYGIYIDAEDSHIGFIDSLNIHRPICYGINNSVDGFWLGGYSIESYKRGIKFHGAKNGYVGNGIMRLRPANVGTVQNGWNGMLIEQSENITFADCEIDDAPEHGIRFGGNGNKTFRFGDLILKRNGGSAIKLNSKDPSSPDRQANENISFGNVSVFDNRYVDPDDDIELTRRGEIIRISHANSISFSSISCFADVAEYTGSTVIAVNNVSQLYIDAVSTENYSGTFFHINETNDVSEDNNPENFIASDIYIRNIKVKDSEAISRNLISCTLAKSSINGVMLEMNSDALNRYLFACPNETTGTVSNIILQGCVHSGVFKFPSTVYHRDAIWLDLTIGQKKVVGPALKSYLYLIGFGSSSHFDPSVDAINGSLFIADLKTSSENDLTFGGSISFCKPGSGGRRGAAIASMQTGSEVKNTGLAVFASTGNTASNALGKGWIFDHSGHFKPYTTLVGSLGDGSHVWSNIYAETSSIGSSDERLKTNISSPSEALMLAWGRVSFKVFQFKHSLEEKGVDNARIHVGCIAQQVIDAFAAEGLNAMRYGIVCYDSWTERKETRVVVDVPAVLDNDGNEVKPAETHLETVTIPAGDRYGIRYEEALALECAYQRWLGEKRDAHIAELEAKLNEVSGSGPAPSGASLNNP